MAESTSTTKIPEISDFFRKNEGIFKQLIDATPDYAIFALDLNGYVLTWNKGAERLKGYCESEIVGRHFSCFYAEEDITRGHPEYELRQALTQGRYEEEGWRFRKDGSRFWANLILCPLRDQQGTIIGFAKITRDLTERRAAEELRRAEEEKFRLLVEGVKDYAILMLDRSGNVSSWNEGARRFKGYEAHEIIGKHFSTFYPAEDRRARKPEMELEVAEATGKFEEEGWRVRKDGTLFWANVLITALYDSNKMLIGFSKVTRDLSERKKNELRLEKAYENLEVRIQEKTFQLEEALKIRDEFLSMASHELKTPITSMKMQIQLALKRLMSTERVPLDLNKQIRSLDIAHTQLDRIVLLVDDLLDISRIQAGKLNYNFEKILFLDLCNEVIEAFSAEIVLAKAEVKVFADPALVGFWDRLRIEQVLVNLISNSLKYAKGSAIVLFAKKDGTNALIKIQDFGPGIPEELRGKMFGRFERLNQNSGTGGLGLGLYISRQIIEGHGGTLTCEPASERGTTFVISVPIDACNDQSAV